MAPGFTENFKREKNVTFLRKLIHYLSYLEKEHKFAAMVSNCSCFFEKFCCIKFHEGRK